MRPNSLCALTAVLLLPNGAALCGEPPAEDKDKAAIAALRAELEERVEVDWADMTVRKALKALLSNRPKSTLRIIERADDCRQFEKHLNMRLIGARAIDILDMLCESAGLHYGLRPGVVEVESVPDSKVTLCMYPVNDLLIVPPDFPPPGGLYSPFRNEAAAGVVPALAPPVTAPLTFIADLIRNRIRPESWDPALGTAIEVRDGLLCAMQRPEVHALVQQFLATLRSRQGRQVSVEVRAFAVKSTDVDRIRREAAKRNVAAPLLDNAGIAELENLAKAGAAAQVFNGASVVHSAQLGLLEDLKTQHLLCEYEMAGKSFDRKANALLTGTVVSFRPALSDDASLVSVTLRLAHTELIGVPENVVVLHGAAATGPLAPSKVPNSSGGVLPAFGPARMQLPVLGRSRILQELVLPAGKCVTLSAPFSGKDGLVPGRELLVLLCCRPLIVPGPAEEVALKHPKEMPDGLRKRLEKHLSIAWVEMPFSNAIEAFSGQTNIPMALDLHGLQGWGEPVTLEVVDVKADQVLGLILRAGNAAIVPYNSLLFVTSRRDRLDETVKLHIFDVRDITRALADFPGERSWGLGTNDAGPETQVAPRVRPAEVPGGEAGDDLATMIRDKMMPADFADPATSIQEWGGKLLVMQRPEVLGTIERLLGGLLKTARRPVLVTARWAVVNSDTLKTAIGEALPQVLGAKEAEKVLDLIAREGSRDLACVRLSCLNGQRSSGFGGVERAFVADYNVNGVLIEPVVKSHIAGAVADVKPLIVGGTGGADAPNQLMIESRLSFSRTDANPAALGPGAEAKEGAPAVPPPPGRIQTPTGHSQDILCTVIIPDGGAALFRAPVPEWLPDEKAAEARQGLRTMIVLLQAQQQKE
ncbi:MAG: hypothetical protein ABSE73_00990 [Planctomycetota bacterium]